MNVKNCRVRVETLGAKVAAYNRGGQHMVNCLYEIGRNLESILPERFYYSFAQVGYVSNLKESNIGYYGAALCFVPEYDAHSENRSEWKPVEEDGWEDAGGWYYLHDDFNKVIHQPTRPELKIIAKGIPAFIADLASYLERNAEENEEATEILQKMIEACTSE